MFSVKEENKGMFSLQVVIMYSRIGQDKAGKPAQLGETSIPRLVKCFEFKA